MIQVRSYHEQLVIELTRRFQEFPAVAAVALGGSQASTAGDSLSDIDLYVHTSGTIRLQARQALVLEMGATRADLDLQFWDLGDEWIDAETGIEVDVIYWDPTWVEGQLDRVWRRHQASLGYSTCLWHTVRYAQPLFDRQGWFGGLQQQSRQPYPEALRQAIIAKNHAVLRRVIPSYAHQIEKAGRRGDQVSLNHRLAALLASYFDVVFALNRVLHPGEKRLMAQAEAHCERLPVGMAPQIEAVLQAPCTVDGGLVPKVHFLLDNLDDLLRQEGFDPTTSLPFR
jgi:predicted nucleotidyltransferase